MYWNYMIIVQNQNAECQKQISFTPSQFQMEGGGFQNTMK